MTLWRTKKLVELYRQTLFFCCYWGNLIISLQGSQCMKHKFQGTSKFIAGLWSKSEVLKLGIFTKHLSARQKVSVGLPLNFISSFHQSCYTFICLRFSDSVLDVIKIIHCVTQKTFQTPNYFHSQGTVFENRIDRLRTLNSLGFFKTTDSWISLIILLPQILEICCFTCEPHTVCTVTRSGIIVQLIGFIFFSLYFRGYFGSTTIKVILAIFT